MTFATSGTRLSTCLLVLTLRFMDRLLACARRTLGSTVLVLAVLVHPAAASARSAGARYVCPFRHAGTVTIDTREPGTSITMSGRTRPATSGSYFYQTADGDVAVMFKPGYRIWSLNGEQVRCTRRPNR